MQIRCIKCDVKNDVIEIIDLADLEHFENRLLLIGKCEVCKKDIAQLIEIRKEDEKVFVNNFWANSAKKIIKKEFKRIKIKTNNKIKFYGFAYGINKEMKNKKGEVVRIKQYSTDFKSDNKLLIKTIFIK